MHTYNTLGEMHERMVTVLISDSLLTSRKKLTKVAAECGFGVAHHEEMDHDFLQNLIRHPRLAQCVNAIIPDGIHCVDQGIEYLRNATVSLNEFHNNRTSRLDALCRAIHNAPRFHQKTAMLTAYNELFCNQVFYQEVKKFNQLLAPYLKSDDANAFALKNYLKRCLNTFGLSDLEKVFQSMHFLSLHFSKLDKAPLIFSEFANISTAKCVSNFLGVPAVVEDVKNAVSKIKQWLQRLLPWYVRTSDDGVFYVEVNYHFHQM